MNQSKKKTRQNKQKNPNQSTVSSGKIVILSPKCIRILQLKMQIHVSLLEASPEHVTKDE